MTPSTLHFQHSTQLNRFVSANPIRGIMNENNKSKLNIKLIVARKPWETVSLLGYSEWLGVQFESEVMKDQTIFSFANIPIFNKDIEMVYKKVSIKDSDDTDKTPDTVVGKLVPVGSRSPSEIPPIPGLWFGWSKFDLEPKSNFVLLRKK